MNITQQLQSRVQVIQSTMLLNTQNDQVGDEYVEDRVALEMLVNNARRVEVESRCHQNKMAWLKRLVEMTQYCFHHHQHVLL